MQRPISYRAFAQRVRRHRRTDVWEAAARPGSQRVTAALTKLRDALGDGPDGEHLVPLRTRDQRIELSEHIGTDLDRGLAHLAIGRDLPGDTGWADLSGHAVHRPA